MEPRIRKRAPEHLWRCPVTGLPGEAFFGDADRHLRSFAEQVVHAPAATTGEVVDLATEQHVVSAAGSLEERETLPESVEIAIDGGPLNVLDRGNGNRNDGGATSDSPCGGVLRRGRTES